MAARAIWSGTLEVGPAKLPVKLYPAVQDQAEPLFICIATFVIRDKEYLVAILAEKGILRAETLRFSDEIRLPEGVGLPDARRIQKAAVHRFEKQIQAKVANDISHQELRDVQSEKLMKLAEEKRARAQGRGASRACRR
jgi:non-homologous end joining protein Ku